MNICLFADGVGEGRGKIDVPGLPDINAKIRGRIDLSGDVPVFDIEDFDVGSAGFIVNAFGAKGAIEDAVNEAAGGDPPGALAVPDRDRRGARDRQRPLAVARAGSGGGPVCPRPSPRVTYTSRLRAGAAVSPLHPMGARRCPRPARSSLSSKGAPPRR